MRCLLCLFPLLLLNACSTQRVKDPAQAQLHYEVGANLLAEGKLPESIAQLERARELDASRYEIHMHLGLAYLRAEDNTKAETSLLTAEKIKGDAPELLNNLSALYLKLGHGAKAADYAQRALKVLTYTTPELALANLGLAQLQQGQSEQALGSFRKAVGRNPDSCQLRTLLVRGLVKLGRFEDGLREVRNAQSKCSLYTRLHAWHGYVLLKAGRQQDARRQFTRLVQRFKRGDAVDYARDTLKLMENYVPPQEPSF